MEYIEFLGTRGTRTPHSGTTSIRVAEHTVLDAGSLIGPLGSEAETLRHIFLTHAHLDHICDLPFLAEAIVATSTEPLCVYGLEETIAVVKSSLFNNEIWPDFSRIPLLNGTDKTVKFHTIEVGRRYEIDGIALTPVKTNHTEGSCGYIVEKKGRGIFVTADTYVSDTVREAIDAHPWIHSLCIDVSFPSEQAHLAKASKHLTPKLLAEELSRLRRSDLAVFPMHLKSLNYKTVVEEIEAYGLLSHERSRIIADGDRIYFDWKQDGTRNRTPVAVDPLIDELAEISVALSSEKHIDSLLELILYEAKKLTHADAGTLYLLNPKTRMLEFKVVHTDSLGIRMGGSGDPITWDALPLYKKDGTRNDNMVAVVSVLEDRMINIEDVYHADHFDFSGTKRFDQKTGYRSKSMLVIPLKNHEDSTIGVLQLINKMDENGLVDTFNAFDAKVSTALASQAAIALTKQQLIDDLETLLESFLHSINVAIEHKSEYTAGHIDKMVTITEMITRAVSEDQTVFKEKSYSEDEFKEIRLAALMHDVGKITTPEHVINKSTKLQTIYDRIETIKMKAEIRKRDARIDYLIKSRNVNTPTKAMLRKQYDREIQSIEEEVAFIKHANKGSEFFSDEKVERVKHIAKSEIVIGGVKRNWLSDDEVKNLTVQKGTLNDEERQIINHHAIVSLEMLKQLPFPKKYARVPEIAGGHHEQINGRGYPLGLEGDELSFETRILAIADIFEALTAADRPYKAPKRLSESMRILFAMAEAGHLDKTIVRFLYESGLYLEIAKRVVPLEFIDEYRPDNGG